MSCNVCGSGGANVGDGAELGNELEMFVEGVGEAGDERAEVEEEETGDAEEPSS